MRMKRKDTQLLVENWRNLLKGEPIAGEPTNEVFFGKRVLNLLKDKIDSKLNELKEQIDKSKILIRDQKQPSDNNELLKLVIETNIDKIVDGQVLMYLKSCMPSEGEVKYSGSKKVKQKVFENVFNDIVSGSIKFGINTEIIREAKKLKNVEVSDGNRNNLQKNINFENPVIIISNDNKIKNIGNDVAKLCNKR